jgi:hypothetical protein
MPEERLEVKRVDRKGLQTERNRYSTSDDKFPE